jgi:hypothetical protein
MLCQTNISRVRDDGTFVTPSNVSEGITPAAAERRPENDRVVH